MEISFRGAGGGGGSATSFVQKPDTLRSTDTFEGLLGLCVGPILGPVDGMKNVRVNDTPIEDDSGNLNFQDFTVVTADGDPLKFPQVCTLRLGAAGSPQAINLTLGNTVGAGQGTWVTHTINDTNAEAIDLRFIVQQLYKQDKSGIYQDTANIEIQMKPVGTTTWINPFEANGNSLPTYSSGGYDMPDNTRLYITNHQYNAQASTSNFLTITGKTSSAFVKELRVTVPNTGVYANKGWDIRCRLNELASVDADPNFEKRTISWESTTSVFNPKLGDDEEWRGFAWMQLYGKASDSFNGVPNVTGIYDTKIVQVPPSSVFDPIARTYTGAIWDGSWAKSFTQDPAWIINDAISDSISGIARLMPGTHLNKWDALELSKYASEQVSDGAGGTHCRFSMNLAITEAQRSDDFIRYLAGACGAAAWDNGDGEWRLVIDRPQTPVDVFTTETIEGEFNYSHTDIDTRFNDVTVTFLNEEFDYRQDRVRITDDAHIAKYGRKPTSVVGIGCTNRQQALRWAILKMRSNVNEFRAVTFTTNRRGKLIERFNWILVADGTLSTVTDPLLRSTGRTTNRRTNYVRNSAFVGATAGTPGTIPNSGIPGSAAGITASVVGTGVDSDGFEYVDIRWAGTSTSTSAPVWFFDAASLTDTPAAALGDTWTSSFDIKVVGGSTAGFTRMAVGTYEYDNTGSVLTGSSNTTFTPTSAYAQQKHTRTFTGATTAHARSLFFLNTGAAGVTVDCTFRFRKPQLEKASAPTEYIRTVNGPAQAITLRDSVRLEVGVAYQINFTAPNPAYAPDSTTAPTDETYLQPTIAYTRNVTNTSAQCGDVTEIFLDTPLPADVAPNANVALSAPNLPSLPVAYRVLDVQYSDDGERVTVNALQVDTGKYPASDTANYTYQMPGYGVPSTGSVILPPVLPPSGKMLTLVTHPTELGGVGRYLEAAWVRPDASQPVKWYRLERRQNDGNWLPVGTTTTTAWELADPADGLHEFRVYTVDPAGKESLPLYDDLTVDALSSTPTVTLVPDDLSFDFIDGVAVNSNQVITVTAEQLGSTEALNWSASPNVALGVPNGTQRTLSLADFGSNSSVTITVTGADSGATASVTLIRSNQTTPDDSIIPDSSWNGTVTGAGGTDITSPGGTPWRLGGFMKVSSA